MGADLEPGENMVDTSWTGASKRNVGAWFVPAPWMEDLPKHGEWEVTYVCENLSPKYCNIPGRKKLTAEAFEWLTYEVPYEPQYEQLGVLTGPLSAKSEKDSPNA